VEEKKEGEGIGNDRGRNRLPQEKWGKGLKPKRRWNCGDRDPEDPGSWGTGKTIKER